MPSKLKTIIVDDDKFQLKIIEDFVQKTHFLSFQSSHTDPIEAFDIISETKPDLILLDIEMPNLSGFDLLKSLDNPPKTIFITGNKEYALKAFDFNVMDYLMKPIDNYPRFLKAVSKAQKQSLSSNSNGVVDHIFVKEDSLLVKVQLDDVLYLEAYGDYVRIFTNAKNQIVHSTLTKITERLPDTFIKVHRSYVVNLKNVVNLDHFNLQVGDKIVPVSKNMRPILLERIDTL